MKTRILFFLSFYLALGNCSRIHNSPELKIQAYSPRGLKVTLQHSPSDHFFAFHANINKQITQNEVGEIFGEVTKKEKGQWVFRNETIKLKNGDKIYYWFIVKFTKLMYFKEGSYVIQDFENSNYPDPVETASPQQSSSVFTQLVVNLTNNVLDLQEELKSLQEINVILKDIIQKDTKLSTTLSLDGLEVSENQVEMVLKAIIKDKMELPYRIQNVQQKSNGRVEFQLDNLTEKLEVIKVSKTKLKNSRYSIIY